nr:immunoglobulin heavy chain junction region [Macaca mulatta]MOW86722.1 immunoglobulin heavy chain junction region [Macaca mulatta]MOW86760.1 immunoglobulin heavy chain junction region [Macaca mulatta]MOW87010.1 immunoglobulin heavy chain junction region [Macaca mulatta]MOW87028.1 immunoglobulin heavy chain junction region [Macaca mulatta]
CAIGCCFGGVCYEPSLDYW